MTDKRIRTAFQALMGVNGDRYVEEIFRTGGLSSMSYIHICSNVWYNGEESIVEHFGVVMWFYFQGRRLREEGQ